MKKWQVIKSEVVHQNPYFSIEAEEFSLGDGQCGKYYLMKSPDFVSVLAEEEGSVYFIEMERYTLRRKILENPMGGIEAGETPLAAARRELKEETGISARSWQEIGCLESCKGRSDQRFTVFIARDLSFGAQELDEVEAAGGARVVKLAIDDLPELIRTGRITDSHTIASVALFMLNYRGSTRDKS